MSLIKNIAWSNVSEQRKFSIGLFAICMLAAVLRFYQLGTIPGPVFDEVYFPEYAYKYLIGEEFFHVHPPLYNYISTASIWIYYHLPWLDLPPVETLSFKELDATSYRWLNALLGSALPLIVALAALALTKVRTFALLIALFVAVDGSIVVDSRHGMNNIFLIFFGFLGVWAACKAHSDSKHKHRWFISAGVFLGCCLSVKWNGLGYVAAIIALLVCACLVYFFDKYRPAVGAEKKESQITSIFPFKIKHYLLYLLVLPAVIYSLLWIPDRNFNTEYSFVGIHKQILGYHANEKSTHPYGSKWHSWPLMERPISYYFKSVDKKDENGKEERYFTDVHLFGNPAIYWLAGLSLIFMIGHWFTLLVRWFKSGEVDKQWLVISAILLGYFANLMPWALVSRVVFLYHYQSASVFSFLALAWYTSIALRSENKNIRAGGFGVIAIVLAACIYWLPFALGLEISATDYYKRMWFTSWI